MGAGSSKGASASTSSAAAAGGDEARKGNGKGRSGSGRGRGRGMLQRLPSSCFRGASSGRRRLRRGRGTLRSSKGGETGSSPSIAQVDKSEDDATVIPKSHPGGASTAGIDSTLDMLRDSVTAQARAAHQARRDLLESDNANLRTIWPSGNASARQNSEIMQRTNSERSSELQLDSSTNSVYNSDSSSLREATNQDQLEHRSAILERRRIQSQVASSPKIGQQHRTGNCNCRASSRPGNSDEETNTRSSISRIVMLAEALFEVLDEIHLQSAALSSRPSFSSIGSVPAPKEVVERLPVQVYRRSLKHQNEEAAQCYICLVEYAEGECVRILPCNHEFHLTCVDKWLKEIHRVCPLCRGDVCRSNASRIGKAS
ncbi:hypothetical protein GUJ93_ZPchr0164g26839 [Zizania palustris]|uniref:RING-type domain-containing protein n=1 Tax=Zizania palustris TaxID=103762 RepID=A0A8J6C2U4_ZIZPA|nr:hypothetical protein GUJ93_ZPchr0164g26839 [Zizania palustris]